MRTGRILPTAAILFSAFYSLATATIAESGPAAAAKSEDLEYHRVFSGSFCGIRFFSPTSGLAVTTNGLLASDGSAKKWKGIAGWDRPDFICYYAGGDEKTVYLVTSSCKDVVVGDAADATEQPPGGLCLSRVKRGGKIVWVRHDYTWTLVRWTRAAGFENIRDIPAVAYDPRSPTHCTFVNADTGAFGEGQQVFITRDAGKTWTGTKVSEKPDRVQDVLWSDANHLIVAKYLNGTLVGLEVDADNRVREKWRTELRQDIAIYYPEPLKLSPDGKNVWVYINNQRSGGPNSLCAINPTDGKVLRTDWPLDELRAMRDAIRKIDPETERFVTKGIVLDGFCPTNTTLYVWGCYLDGCDGFTAAYDLATKKIVGTAAVERCADDIADVVRVSDRSAMLVLRTVGQMIPWNGQTVVLPADSVCPWNISRLHGPEVDNTLLDEAEDRRPGTDERPSRREFRECEKARRVIPLEIQLKINQEHELGDFDNYRQYLLWLTKRFHEEADADVSTTPASSPIASASLRTPARSPQDAAPIRPSTRNCRRVGIAPSRCRDRSGCRSPRVARRA